MSIANLDVLLRCHINEEEKLFFIDDKKTIYEFVVTMPNHERMAHYIPVDLKIVKETIAKATEIDYYNDVLSY